MQKINIFLSSVIRVKKDSLPPTGIALFEKRLTFRNPLYFKNERWGKANPPNIKPTLSAIWHDDEKGELVIARGYLSELIRILHANRFQPEIIDQTRTFESRDFQSDIMTENRGINWPDQGEALKEISKHRFCILAGPLNSGKKMLACKLAARRKVPVLVIVNTHRDLYLWRETVKQYLNLKDEDIGLIGDNHREAGRPVTIGITLTLYKMLDQVEPFTGFIIIDQCEKANLKVFFKVALFNCPFILGLANSANRADGLTKLMEAYIGQRVYQLKPPEALSQIRPVLKIRDTGFDYEYHDDWPEMVTALCENQERNALIMADILQAVSDRWAKILVVSERIGHLEDLKARVDASYVQAEILTGETTESRRADIVRRFTTGRLQIVMVTFKSIPTIDIKKVNHLFFISPVKFDAFIIQLVGRLLVSGNDVHRAFIHDYKDIPEQLKNSYRRRMKTYRRMGATA